MNTQETYIGEGSIRVLTELLRKKSPQKRLIVRGKKSYSLCGAQKIIKNLIDNLKLTVSEFSDFTENPKEEDVIKGLQVLYREKPEIIIGIGGGSVIDMSKLLRFYYYHPNKFKTNSIYKSGFYIPLIAIPTTAGTGSEATHFAVMYSNKIKFSIAHPDVLPDVAIVDPVFTYHNPAYLTACTGFDALAQAIESYWNVAATTESQKFALQAIQLIWENLPLAINNENCIEVRQKIAEGAFWAGKAINITKTTGPHALSYSFTTYYHIPHGHAVAYTFPFFFAKNTYLKAELDYQERIETLLKILNVKSTDNRTQFFINYLEKISLSLRLPEEFDFSLILSNINMDRLKNNPGIKDIIVLKRELYNYFLWLNNR